MAADGGAEKRILVGVGLIQRLVLPQGRASMRAATPGMPEAPGVISWMLVGVEEESVEVEVEVVEVEEERLACARAIC